MTCICHTYIFYARDDEMMLSEQMHIKNFNNYVYQQF